MKPAAVLLLALMACSTRQTEHRSTTLGSASRRAQFLADFAMSPSTPQDVAFHIFETDDGTVVHAIMKIDVANVPLWSTGCENRTLEARPAWVKDVLPRGWALKTAPDTWRCGTEKRVIHVKEGLIIRSLLLEN